MKLAFLFTLQAALLVWLGVLASGWVASLVFLYLGATFGILALAYVLDDPRLMMKRTNGTLHPLAWLPFGPWFLLALGVGGMLRKATQEAPYHEVYPGLYIGRRLSTAEVKSGRAPKDLAGILDLTSELNEARPFREHPNYLCIPVLDVRAPTPENLERGLKHIAQTLERGPCYVHCAMGHGRAATFVSAHLISTGRAKTMDEAENLLKAIRPGVSLKTDQRKCIARLEKRPEEVS